MFRNITQNRGHFALVLLLILGVVTGSLIIDAPVPTQETEAGWAHKCCRYVKRWDGCKWATVEVCKRTIHFPWSGHRNICPT